MVEKMGKRCGAIGFAIYLDELERLRPAQLPWDADVLVRYDDQTDLTALTGRMAELAAAGKKALAQKEPGDLRVKETIDMRGGEQA